MLTPHLVFHAALLLATLVCGIAVGAVLGYTKRSHRPRAITPAVITARLESQPPVPATPDAAPIRLQS